MVAVRHESPESILGLRPDDFPSHLARNVLGWCFTDEDRARLGKLLEKNSAGSMGEAEKRELRAYVVLGEMLDLLHAKARASLQQAAAVEKH